MKRLSAVRFCAGLRHKSCWRTAGEEKPFRSILIALSASMAFMQQNLTSGSLDALANFDKLRKAAKPVFSNYYAPATLEVTGGLHAGAQEELPQKNLTIGSSYECDIVLLGDGLRPEHARIRLADVFGQKLIVEAVGDEIGVNQRDAIAIGQTAEVSLPVSLELGRAVVKIQPRALSANGAKWIPRLIAGLFLLIGVAIFGGQWGRTATQGVNKFYALTNLKSQPQRIILANADSSPQTIAASSPADMERAFETLQNMLSEAGLKDSIRLQKLGNDRILAAGALDSLEMTKWRGILQSYDSIANFPVTSNDIKEIPTRNDAPVVASVWVGKTPQIMTQNGEVAGVGETVGRGWLVTAKGGGVALERNGRTIQISY